MVPAFSKVDYQTASAFHGTRRADAESIWRDRAFLKPKQDLENSRFGPGVYFWENSPNAARNWVKIFYKTADCGIIRAQVRCLSLLDLLTSEHFQVLETTRLRLAQHEGKNVEEIRHAAVLSFLHAANVIDGARLISGLGAKSKIDKDSQLAGPFEVILCVYEPMNIVVTEFYDN